MLLVKAELKPDDVENIITIERSKYVTLDGGVNGACCDYEGDGQWFLVKIFDSLEDAVSTIQSLTDNNYQAIVKRV